MNWFTYIIRCADGTLYTGTTNDLKRRVKMHNDGTGAKYTRGRGPVVLVWSVPADSQSEACRTETRVKRLSRSDKEALILNSSDVRRVAQESNPALKDG